MKTFCGQQEQRQLYFNDSLGEMTHRRIAGCLCLSGLNYVTREVKGKYTQDNNSNSNKSATKICHPLTLGCSDTVKLILQSTDGVPGCRQLCLDSLQLCVK